MWRCTFLRLEGMCRSQQEVNACTLKIFSLCPEALPLVGHDKTTRCIRSVSLAYLSINTTSSRNGS